MSAATHADGYKFFHKSALHDSIVRIYENFTPRSGKLSNIPKPFGVVHAGMQYFLLHHLVNEWENTFFNLDEDMAVSKLKRRLTHYFGAEFEILENKSFQSKSHKFYNFEDVTDRLNE
jgi:nicotinamide phosphoribosyltransferase